MVRVWCVPFTLLADRWLLGQHREAHSMITAEAKRLSGVRGGYQNHPELVKYRGRLGVLVTVHDLAVEEMQRRGMNHSSPVRFGYYFGYGTAQERWTPANVAAEAEPFTYTAEETQRDVQHLTERGGLK